MPTDRSGAPAEADYVRAIRRKVEAEAHVGLHPWERHPERPSRLLVSVEMMGAIVSTLKPDIFNEAAGAGIEIRRSRSPHAGEAA